MMHFAFKTFSEWGGVFISVPTCQLSCHGVPRACIRQSDWLLRLIFDPAGPWSPVVSTGSLAPLYIEWQLLCPALTPSKPGKQHEEQRPR